MIVKIHTVHEIVCFILYDKNNILVERRTVSYNNLAFATKSDFFCPDPGVFCGQMRPIFQTVQYFRLLKIFFVPFGHKPCGHENPLLWPKAAVKSIGLTTKYN